MLIFGGEGGREREMNYIQSPTVATFSLSYQYPLGGWRGGGDKLYPILNKTVVHTHQLYIPSEDFPFLPYLWLRGEDDPRAAKYQIHFKKRYRS